VLQLVGRFGRLLVEPSSSFFLSLFAKKRNEEEEEEEGEEGAMRISLKNTN
jgi:hypothetical protein